MRNDSPGMLKQLQQKVELRKASGLDSWKAVPTPTFQLYLGPCHFTSGFCLKGAHLQNYTKITILNQNKVPIKPVMFVPYTGEGMRARSPSVG